MQVWAPLMLSGAALLLVSGMSKLRAPGPTVTALRSVGLSWANRSTVTAITAAELVVGTAALALGGRAADCALGAMYLGFAVFLLRALTLRSPSCGCSGRDNTPPSVAHLAMTAMYAAGAAGAVIAGGQTGLGRLAHHVPVGQLTVAVGLAATATWLAWAVLTLSLPVPAQTSQ